MFRLCHESWLDYKRLNGCIINVYMEIYFLDNFYHLFISQKAFDENDIVCKSLLDSIPFELG